MVSSIFRVIRSKSLRYILFRSKYELERKTGLMALKYPTRLKPVPIPLLEEWRKNGCGWFFDDRSSLSIKKRKSDELKKKMDHFLNGDVLFFSKTWKALGFDYDWVTNPETGYHYDSHQHWTKVNDFSMEAGDIKFVWEKSRFSWLLTVCRYDYHFDEDHAEFAVGQILDWIDKNPLNCGPNYKCSQETSIRILNWLFALNFYRKSNALTDERWTKIMTSIYWQIDHVRKNINFSRIAVRNNHAITETLTLYLMGLFFPMMKGACDWKRKGKKWFEQEIDYQIEDDGTYIQDSMNYHRVVVQLLTYAIAISDRHSEKFCDLVYEKAYKSVNFLFQCQEPTNGWLPNYGANDGSLFFPLNDADYRDYRPQIDALHFLLTRDNLYDEELEDAKWICNTGIDKSFIKIEKKYGVVEFKKSGYYLIRERNIQTFIRCGLFKTNGSNDLLHLDIWYKGNNILMDGGSYKYNTDDNIVRYFAGTESHNTIMIGENDMMQKGSRFMWFYPPIVMSANLQEDEFNYIFEGEINTYKHLVEGGVTIHRIVKKLKNCLEWEIIDIIDGAPDDIVKRQLWHTNSELFFDSDGERIVNKGLVSDYYGDKQCNKQIEFITKGNQIVTMIKISQK